jgi:hypothetical protein
VPKSLVVTASAGRIPAAPSGCVAERVPASAPAGTEGSTMTNPVRRRTVALLAAAAVTTGPVLSAAPAFAHAPRHHAVTCTITAAERTETTDALTALKGRLAGHKPTAAEKTALKAAIAELRAAAEQKKQLSAANRKAKRAEYTALVAKLKAATTAEQRTAIRAELRALRDEVAASRPTRAEWRALGHAINDLKVALRAKPTKAEKRAILAQIKTLKAKLACQTAPATTDSTGTTTTPGTDAA